MDGRDRMTDLQKNILSELYLHYVKYDNDNALSIDDLHNNLINNDVIVSKYQIKKQLRYLKNLGYIELLALFDTKGKLCGNGYYLTALGRYFDSSN